ncbi:hypothetical protein PROFUN_02606 [Planoprotostelium fungivorum]|uniref:Pentatricopeptide repeat-containing protein n=1 Tax=Planoprotostelium fungivorum TaxID=1890364 RepID=A0A2P6NV76_9EUKA|nr:hypothetical protein PROFUN_02606 [Planoprotostelium fungivorum]
MVELTEENYQRPSSNWHQKDNSITAYLPPEHVNHLERLMKDKRIDPGHVAEYLKKMSASGVPLDTAVYNNIIRHYFLEGDGPRMQRVYSLMRANGHQPNANTYTFFIQYFFSQDDYEKAEKWLGDMERAGYYLGMGAIITGLRYFARHGKIKEAENYLSKIEQPDNETFKNILADSRPEDIPHWVSLMERYGLYPDIAIVNSILQNDKSPSTIRVVSDLFQRYRLKWDAVTLRHMMERSVEVDGDFQVLWKIGQEQGILDGECYLLRLQLATSKGDEEEIRRCIEEQRRDEWAQFRSFDVAVMDFYAEKNDFERFHDVVRNSSLVRGGNRKFDSEPVKKILGKLESSADCLTLFRTRAKIAAPWQQPALFDLFIECMIRLNDKEGILRHMKSLGEKDQNALSLACGYFASTNDEKAVDEAMKDVNEEHLNSCLFVSAKGYCKAKNHKAAVRMIDQITDQTIKKRSLDALLTAFSGDEVITGEMMSIYKRYSLKETVNPMIRHHANENNRQKMNYYITRARHRNIHIEPHSYTCIAAFHLRAASHPVSKDNPWYGDITPQEDEAMALLWAERALNRWGSIEGNLLKLFASHHWIAPVPVNELKNIMSWKHRQKEVVQAAFEEACQKGQAEVVGLLLKDVLVTPTIDDGRVLKGLLVETTDEKERTRRANVLKVLMQNSRSAKFLARESKRSSDEHVELEDERASERENEKETKETDEQDAKKKHEPDAKKER